MNRRIVGAVLAAAAVLPLTGCVPANFSHAVPFVLSATVFAPSDPQHLAGIGFQMNVTANASGSVGGKSGTYTVTLDNPAGGTLGVLSGTAKVKGSNPVTLKDSTSSELFNTVGNLLTQAVGGEAMQVTQASAKVTADQSGKKVHYTVDITFTATVLSGSATGSTITGTLTAKDKF